MPRSIWINLNLFQYFNENTDFSGWIWGLSLAFLYKANKKHTGNIRITGVFSANVYPNLCIAWKESVFRVFLVLIFPHSHWIRRDTPYLSVSSPNAGKYRPEKLRIRTLFTPEKLRKRNLFMQWWRETIFGEKNLQDHGEDSIFTVKWIS